MRIRVSTANQVKLLSQLGEFGDNDETWKGRLDPEDSKQVVEMLRRAGANDWFVEFGQ
jgi:hypothetical protein